MPPNPQNPMAPIGIMNPGLITGITPTFSPLPTGLPQGGITPSPAQDGTALSPLGTLLAGNNGPQGIPGQNPQAQNLLQDPNQKPPVDPNKPLDPNKPRDPNDPNNQDPNKVEDPNKPKDPNEMTEEEKQKRAEEIQKQLEELQKKLQEDMAKGDWDAAAKDLAQIQSLQKELGQLTGQQPGNEAQEQQQAVEGAQNAAPEQQAQQEQNAAPQQAPQGAEQAAPQAQNADQAQNAQASNVGDPTAEEQARINQILSQLPPEQREAIKSVKMGDLQPGVGGLTSSVDGGGSIILDRNAFQSNGNYILLHEAGHAVDFKYGISGNGFGQGPFVTNYAQTNRMEDFAESFAHYYTNPGKLQATSPAKYNVVASLPGMRR
ncbi:MAG: hypothetical protein HYU64_01325 [Armatimonadetes bacterium]|nr:hypothetical protein [Armatimonadota bacterium]